MTASWPPAPTTPMPVPSPGTGITYRPYAGLEDIPGMAASRAALFAAIGLMEQTDVDTMRHRYTHLVNSDPLVDCMVVELGGEIVGYARAEWHNLVDGDRVFDNLACVAPAAWDLGVIDACVAWTEARSRDLAPSLPGERRTWLQQYAMGKDLAYAAALERHGYSAVRWDAEMRRPHLEDIPVLVVPDGYTLRSPSADELDAVYRMSVDGFAEHWGEYEGEDHHVEEWSEDPRLRLGLVVVAWHGDRPAAVVSNMLQADDDGRVTGYVQSVVTHPSHRRRGLARACLVRSLELLRAEGAASAYLGVDTDNHNRALALYESCGFQVETTSTVYRKPLERGEAGA